MSFWSVKDKVIPCIPHSLNNRTNSHPNFGQFFFRDVLEPIPKQIIYILRWNQTKSHVNYLPHNFHKSTVKEKMLYDSLQSQKQHNSLPVQFRLTRLSFVRITLRCKNHINTFILSGTFIFHMYFRIIIDKVHIHRLDCVLTRSG
jgi:hypothetical protein